jgi:hypothetical protein
MLFEIYFLIRLPVGNVPSGPTMGSMAVLTEIQEMVISSSPDRLIMLVPGLSGSKARNLANAALREARRVMPKLTGGAANRMFPLYGAGYFGIGWQDSYVWFQEQGIKAFTMFSLAGKVIPMWVSDPAGTVREKNPKARTRMTLSGTVQVLIFRKAASIGQMKTVSKKVADGTYEQRQVPMHYPGAPGRIGKREAAAPYTTPGRVAGAIARGNVGVWWRHPGLAPRKFLNHAMAFAAQQGGISPERLYAADRTWRSRF